MSTWILLRGLTRESRHWGEFTQKLRAQLPEAQVVAIDFPGNGRFHHLRSPTTVEEMMEFCRAELRKQDIASPYYLIAISLGGMVAAAWAARHPDEVRACVLINTSMRAFSSFKQRLRPRHYRTLLRLMFKRLTAEQIETEVLRMTTNHSASAERLEQWTRYRHEYPVSRRNALRQLLAAGRYRAPPRKLACPVLLLASTQDGMVDPQCSRQLAAAWQAQLVEHPTAGHDLTVDDDLWVAQKIGDWWRESLSRT